MNRQLECTSTTYGVFLLLLFAIFSAFHNALSCYFTADDFWHLPRMYKAFNENPIFLLENFWKPWADKTNLYLFYRPFTEITLALDYLFFKGNAWGYHLSNLIYHWLNSCLVFLVSKKVFASTYSKNSISEAYLTLSSIAVALIFAIHPINTAPVVWVLARADLIGTLFYLLSINFLIESIRSKKESSNTLALIFFSLGLLSKESCATIPIVAFAIFAIVQFYQSDKSALSLDKVLSCLSESFSRTRIYWCILAIYLLIRAIVLGSFSGGYVGSTAFILNDTIWARIFSPLSFWKVIHPFNSEIFTTTSILEIILRGIYSVIGLLVVLNAIFSNSIEQRTKLFYGSIVFVLILLCVNIPVWNINDMLHGSRMAYLMGAPLAVALVCLILPNPKLKSEKWLFSAGLITIGLFCFTLANISYKNTKAWQISSSSIRSFQSETIKRLDELPLPKKLAVLNTPQFVKGTFVFFTTDYVQGMLKPPLAPTDYSKRFICLDGPYVQSAEINSSNFKSVLDNKNIEIANWSSQKLKLVSIDKQALKSLSKHLSPAQKKVEIKPIGYYSKVKGQEKKSVNNLFLNIEPGDKIKSYVVKLPVPFSIPNKYIVSLDLSTTNDINAKSPLLSQLQEVNQFLQDGSTIAISWPEAKKNLVEPDRPIEFFFKSNKPTLRFRLPLFENRQLTLKPAPKTFRIDLGSKNLKLINVRVINQELLKPKLVLVSKFKFLANGSRVPESNFVLFDFDISSIQRAKSLRYEISKPNCQFELLSGSNSLEKSTPFIESSKLIPKQAGQFEIDTNQFLDKSKNSFYQVRAIALDTNNEAIGVYSNPITLDNIAL